MKDYDELRGDALHALQDGDSRRAYQAFRWALEYPGRVPDGRFVDALQVLTEILRVAVGDELAGTAQAAAAAPEDPRALYDLGFALIDLELHGIAATLLARAYARAPGTAEVLAELAVALECADRHAEAYRILREARPLVDQNFILRYLLAFDALMSLEIDAAAGELVALERLAADPDHHQLLAAIRTLVGRAQAVRGVTALHGSDLRGWHAVVTGGLLLHLSPHGFDEGMNGRYAYTQDSEARCAAGLRALAAALSAWRLAPPRVFALPDRESAILAEAAGAWFGAPVVPWPPGGTASPGLVVAYDLDAVEAEVLATLGERASGQVLFAHACCWTAPPPIAPDVCTYLHQYNVSPWGERMRIDPQTRLREDLPAESGDPHTLGARCAAAAPEEDGFGDLDAVLALAAVLFPVEGQRERFRTDSPVKSSRFA